MSKAFPLYIDLEGNNCTVFGGDSAAYAAIMTLLQYDAKVTVISPTVCPEIEALDANRTIRYLRRRYCRGDCSGTRLCVAFTDTPALNISISDECKNKGVPVAVNTPAGFGNFTLPQTTICGDTVVAVANTKDEKIAKTVLEKIEKNLPRWVKE